MMQVRPFILAAAVAAAGLSTFTAVGPALASGGGIAVQHDDLNLSSPTGRAVLDRRIDRAARQVCGTALTIELELAGDVNACRAEVVGAARAQRDALIAGDRYAELRVHRNVRSAY
jgi:UrcA family protein